ncbi:hypothetical protein, conserved [Trypanosoma brucei brucei TREU927]|uniref:Uncharacterized protein n=1 Tax=Trypanosoma brucei brucei (strain 927/4 GUTat10.1) TaxID=185431 RepID=Q583Y3_TRYB2|nr:hypothetical protein, conserved [Trypanosoma brucei brucei TREU927]AAX79851.1 hypothetical protein, conserved [Trypanosoma brucei]AAZ10897.1 hypothetical protein, conserved [Trypanosoma brucei brucei TREU927]
MEIIDRPLSEIIKEQNIAQSLRRNRRGGKGNQQRRPRGGARGAVTGGNRGVSRPRRGLGRDRFREVDRRRLLSRRPDGPFRRFRPSYGRVLERRRNAVDYGDVRSRRSVKSTDYLRERRLSGSERNERLRYQRRREELSRVRSRFSRD